MEKEKIVLDPEILDQIKPFSGTQEEWDGMKMIEQGRTLQKVGTQYTTAVAVQKPRSITRIVDNVLEEAKLAGANFYYEWPVKNKDGSTSRIGPGPSIDLSMCLARNYGNDAIDVQVEETMTHYLFKGFFIDLESGFTCPRLYRQRKKQDIGMKDQGRAEDITFQIGQSKAIRNAIVRAMPDWLVERAIEVAKEAELGKIKPENLHLARAKATGFFKPYGIEQNRIEMKLGRKSDNWTAEDIVELRGMATALKEGRISANELFPPIDESDSSVENEKRAMGKKRGRKPKKQQAEKDLNANLPQSSPPQGYLYSSDDKDLPDDEEIMKKLAEARKNVPYLYEKALDELRITSVVTLHAATEVLKKINELANSA